MRAQAPRRPGHRAEPCPAPRCTPGHRPCPSAGTHRRGMRHGSVACEARALQRRRAARRDACGAGSREAHLPPPRLQHKMSQDHTVLHTVLVLHSPRRPSTNTRTRCQDPPPHTLDAGAPSCRLGARWPGPRGRVPGRSLRPCTSRGACLPARRRVPGPSSSLPPVPPPPFRSPQHEGGGP